MGKASDWEFTKRFRRGGFGWRASRLASQRIAEAIQGDDPPYLESMDDRGGELCAPPEIASRWADRLTDLVQHVNAERRRGQHAFTRADSLCHCALFSAGRHDELIKLIGGDPRPMWRDLLWVGRIGVARGEIDEAIEFMAKSVNSWMPMAGLARFAEGVLLNVGRRTEAYEKHALEANRTTTCVATFRLIAGKYPEIDPDRVQSDLIATTPGEDPGCEG